MLVARQFSVIQHYNASFWWYHAALPRTLVDTRVDVELAVKNSVVDA